jgi:transposase-like protein
MENLLMRNDEVDVLLAMLDRIEVGQKRRLQAALAAGEEEVAVVELLESRLGPDPVGAHCRADGARPWGRSHGLRRYRCTACGRTFNALTGTALARLRHKGCWLRFAACLSESATVREAATQCGVARATSFRWRHRFLRADVADAETFSGIVEADETFFRRSFKGSWCWRDRADPPSRLPKKRAMPAQKRGLSDEQVPVLITRDRSGATRAAVLNDRSAEAIDAAIGEILPADGVLCSDTWRPYGVVAGKHEVRHEPVNFHQGERVRDKTWHIQNANARHSRLKGWIAGFKGVATKHLPNYLAWHHVLDRKPSSPANGEWLRLAING